MKPKIIMDTRENPLIKELLEMQGAEVQNKLIPTGDFICSDRAVVERKTRSDFEGSIIDGRLFQQLKRLKEEYHSPIIIVEGKSPEKRINKKALLGAYSSILTDFNCGLFFTRNLESTAEVIYSIAHHEQIAKKREVRIAPSKKGRTMREKQRAIVEMLPLVGPKMAEKLLKHFGSIKKLFNAKEEKLLKMDGMGKIGAKTIKNVIEGEYE